MYKVSTTSTQISTALCNFAQGFLLQNPVDIKAVKLKFPVISTVF